MRISLLFTALVLVPLVSQSQTPARRPIRPGDIYRLSSVRDPKISPEGNWVAYVLTTVDSVKDKRNSDIWMISWDGLQSVQLTHSADGESSPLWSPDGKYLSFLSSRQGSKGNQVWLMDRRGGEARKLTDVKGDLSDYRWSPDGKRLLLVIQDPADTSKTKTAKPLVIDRYQFKADVIGYLSKRYQHLYTFDIDLKKLDTLTKGNHNEASPEWSPDGSKIVFVSNRTTDPDKNNNTDLWIMEVKKNASPRQLTQWKGSDHAPKWSPNGKQIGWLRSTADDNFLMYDQAMIAVASTDGGEPRLLAQGLDRPVNDLSWNKDGQSFFVTVEDDRQRYVAQIGLATAAVTRIAGGDKSFSSLHSNGGGKLVALMSEPQLPDEIFAIENATVRRLTHHQDDFIAPLQLASVRGFVSKSKDGTAVSGLLYTPYAASPNQKLPTIFYIHGGPVSQDEFEFDLSRQVLAASGYNVVAVNYRGSNGRGLAYCKAIYADWGNKEVQDIQGAADYLVKEGIADPERLGIGGWSYGGILTDYCIATDTRFKAAVSGAGSALQLSIYGSDQYVLQYENELGVPWKNVEKYLKLSYPFLKADRIKTPTLFMVGEKDFNVPAVGSEQMYQALRSQDIPTELVIYPGQYHGISIPGYQRDRLVRYLAWYEKYLKGVTPGPQKINKEVR